MFSPNRNFHGKEKDIMNDEDFDFEDNEEENEEVVDAKDVNVDDKSVSEKNLSSDLDSAIDEENEEENEEENDEENLSKLEKDVFRNKMIRLFLIVFVGLIAILLISFIISLFSKKNYDYSTVEEIMEEAAKSYFIDHKDKLPATTDKIVEIPDSILVNNDYMKPLDKYLNESCTGKVDVEKVNSGEYNYVAYLNCGDYKTIELYNAVKKQGVITDGYGLYNLNNEYVFRGKEVKNYLKFSDSDTLWRIVKVTSKNEVVLIQENATVNSYAWDDRYNTKSDDNSGINSFRNSYILTVLDYLYNNKLNEIDNFSTYYDEEVTILTKHDRSRLVKFDACIGSRSTTDTSRDGSTECREKYNTKIALLPVYDYMNASLDKNCTTTLSLSCQNYNYLAKESNTWLITGVLEDSDRVYSLSKTLTRQTASDDLSIMVVVHVGTSAMVDSGTGDKDDPYIIR